jgi:uncharacterized protein YggE
MTRPYAAIATTAILFSSVSASAQVAAPPPYTLLVWGEATVEAPPDSVSIDIAVETRGDTARQAATDNSTQTTRVINELKKVAGSAATITSAGYSVQPQYRYPREGAEPQVAGYRATNVIRVETATLDSVGLILDSAVTAGANRVQRLEFTLKNEHAVYATALREAAVRARTEADALATALGVKVMRVLTATEEPTIATVPPQPFAAAARAADRAAPPTPIEPGTVDVHARVRLTVEFTAESTP